MPNQDYVSRSPAKKKNNTNTKTTKKGSTAGRNNKTATTNSTINLKTKLVTVVAIILICAFVYGLWVLKTASSTKTPATIPAQVKAKDNAKTQTKTLPAPPKEKWTYVKDLENKKIEVGKYEVKEKGPYQMQCGSFRTEKQAQVLKANIAFAGISSQIRTVKGKSGTWHKVVLGPYARKRLAEKDKHKLKRNSINYCQIWLWR